MGKIKIQEVLESADVNYGAFLIYSEVIEGARRPLVFFDTVTEDFSLIGSTGTQIYVPTSTQLTATKLTSTIEDTISSGFTAANKTISKVLVLVSTFVYSSISLTDILKEDYPNIDWLRLHLHNMGKAVMEQIDADIDSLYSAGMGITNTVASCNYVAVTNTLAIMAAGKWMAEPDNPPFLIVGPDVAAKLVQDTLFILTERFYAGLTPQSLEGEVGRFAGCKVLQTPLLAGTGVSYIVFPPNFKWGPVSILAWKRKMRVREQRYEDKELSIFATTARYQPVVIQAAGIAKIVETSTP
jgi:hypothetical protein